MPYLRHAALYKPGTHGARQQAGVRCMECLSCLQHDISDDVSVGNPSFIISMSSQSPRIAANSPIHPRSAYFNGNHNLAVNLPI